MSVLRSRALLGLYSPKSSWSSLKRLAKSCTIIVEKKLDLCLRLQWALADSGLDEGLHEGLHLSRSF
jgi:hypothetical protein